MKEKILVLHGPNLNLLGTREPTLYGGATLQALNDKLVSQAACAGFELLHTQSNSESELMAHIHQALPQKIAYLIFNPAAFTHTSLALRDALLAVQLPFIEVHLTNIYARESFRHHSYFSDIAIGTITGMGIQGYFLALQAILDRLSEKR
ncbi:MAG: type II 3-dehydroquinate dehydratase [Legionella sp.]|nr:type II 3-dehydroquinate dehydratase [Legionella sp.]